jgi:hypothetical protein
VIRGPDEPKEIATKAAVTPSEPAATAQIGHVRQNHARKDQPAG